MVPSPSANEARTETHRNHPDLPTLATGHYESTFRFLIKEYATVPAPPLNYNGSVWAPYCTRDLREDGNVPTDLTLEHKM
jgi:hypothetical protein